MRTGRPKGTKQTPETIEKIRQSNIARWQDPEYRAIHMERLWAARNAGGNPGGRKRGTKQSPETIEKIRRTMIKRWQEPEFRARHLPHLLSIQSAGGRATAFLPRSGTPERKQYNKVRAILGLEAARALSIKSAETEGAGRP
jgi:hypothetical protein